LYVLSSRVFEEYVNIDNVILISVVFSTTYPDLMTNNTPNVVINLYLNIIINDRKTRSSYKDANSVHGR